MRPLVFDRTIGWLHEGDAREGVVIAGAHGFEDLCSRRFLTQLARSIAARGVPVLQFDYPGCGDAAGDHTLQDGVARWSQSIDRAVDGLRRETGVDRVTLVGFRLGALLAPLTAVRREDVDRMVLLAPPASGKAYVRELAGLAAMIDGRNAAATEEPAFDGLEAAGFRMSAQTLADLRDLPGPMACESVATDVLAVPRDVTPAFARAAERFQAAGTALTLTPFGGYAALMCDPTASLVPETVIATCTDWIAPRAGSERSHAPMREPAWLAHETWRERPILIEGEARMCGVFCRPAAELASDEAVLILNSGAVPHVGWARQNVDMARALAAAGIASLRIDLPGLGQSEKPAVPGVFLYDRRTRHDVVRAVDWLAGEGFSRAGVIGLCSGAFQAFQAARIDPRIRRITMINPLCFAWNASYALDMTVWKAYETSKAARPAEPAVAEAERPASRLRHWRTVTAKAARRTVRHGLEGVKSTLPRFSPLRLVAGSPVERSMRALSERGVEVMIVVSKGDLSEGEIERHFGPEGRRLAAMPGVTMRTLSRADHTLTPVSARRNVTRWLVAFSGGRSASGEGVANRAGTRTSGETFAGDRDAKIGRAAG
ncbi:alpha/beta fold hydrolase [Pararhizobium mangrovi]|uniref:Alpha/beta fold hydrolase n=1 Tax=Pararhizobium mangrovi TaxID=2590452 RepID=A0A506UHN4_9HYPH|nr:alpha/beta fold hydrolase [Pararhizobium mangrovi]TPW32808.1 alpha/beta fold hydrolase [Pararhizobium mangrovi]